MLCWAQQFARSPACGPIREPVWVPVHSAAVSAPTPHLSAQLGEIAPLVLLPGDPLRAQFIAETFLTDVTCHNRVRNMLGFTGTWNGHRVSVQGTGMGMPSMSIYSTELFRFYGVTTAIRIGSCGALQSEISLGDVVIAMSASTTSSSTRRHFRGIDFAATADYGLLAAAVGFAASSGVRAHVGPILTSDAFYDEDESLFALVAAHGVLGVEMEAAALYTIAARHRARALCLATVSDHIVRREVMSSEEREKGLSAMVEIALATLTSTS
jgi:purine-nucleoside phosphorylase